MTKGLFIHDHKFPINNHSYFFSYGFDDEFFSRYKNIFSEFSVIGREKQYDIKCKEISEKVIEATNFFTINNYKKLLRKSIRKKIEKEIYDAEALVVRLPSILGLYSIYLANKINTPYVIELVGCPWDAYWNMGLSKKMIAPIMKYLTKKVVYNSKYTIYVTEYFLQKRYPTKGNSIACSNVTLKEIKEEFLNERLKTSDGFTFDKKIILGTIGTVDSIYKGQQYVIEAIGKLKEEGYKVEYHLVGGGDKEYLSEVAQKNNVSKNVVFQGKFEHKEIFKWLKNIDIYLQPSDTEGLPRSVIEAMSVGCPVIGSNAGGIPELIDSSLIFNKGDVNELTNLIKGITIESLYYNAIRNFDKSKQYKKSLLYERRENFFELFISNEVEVE